MTHRDESEFVWAIDAHGDRVRIPRTHLTVFAGSFRLEPSESKAREPIPAKPDNHKEK